MTAQVEFSTRGHLLGLIKVGAPTVLEVFDSLPWFKPAASWKRWRAFLAAAFGLPMDAEELEIFQTCTGRRTAPTTEATEITSIIGRRGGKTAIDAFIVGYLSTYRDYRPFIRDGETVFFPIVAADKKGTRTACGYLKAWFKLDGHTDIADTSHADTEQERYFEFHDVPVRIEVFTASFRTVRGYTVAGFLGDECAYWRTKDDSANPDREIVRAVRPTMATIPNAKLMLLSSPYFQDGILWDHFDQRWGRDIPGALVWKAASTYMNPSPRIREFVAQQYLLDEVAADAEYGANFRSDTSKFITLAKVRELTMAGTEELNVQPLHDDEGNPVGELYRLNYHAFVDVSGGASDSFTLAIAHWDYEVKKGVLDLLRETRPPFKPKDVVHEYARLLRRYRCRGITGDAFGGEWPREPFEDAGFGYTVSELKKSEIYREVLPAMNSNEVLLLEHKVLRDQLVSLQRKKSPTGREVIDHPRGLHDDVANAACGALLEAVTEGRWMRPANAEQPGARTTHEIVERMAQEMADEMRSDGRPERDDQRPPDAQYATDDIWAQD